MATNLTPAGAPPPGAEPNFDAPNTLLPAIIATCTLCITLTTAFAIARGIARRTVSSYGIEDWLLLGAWALLMAYNGVVMAQGVAGLGQDIWNVRALDAIRIAQLSWAIELLYCPLTWLAKAALLLQLQRTFVATQKSGVYYTIQILLWTNLAFYTTSFVAVVLECIPQERIWNPLITTGHCIETFNLLIAMGGINVVSDLAILVLPIVAIWHLRMSPKLKLGVSAIFATGLLAFACSIARLIYTVQSLWDTNTTRLYASVAMWSVAEPSSIILCTCFPMMPRFLQVVRGTHESHASKRSYTSGTTYNSRGYVATYDDVEADQLTGHAKSPSQSKGLPSINRHGSYPRDQPYRQHGVDDRIHKTVQIELSSADHGTHSPT